jgi:hypothetical protein
LVLQRLAARTAECDEERRAKARRAAVAITDVGQRTTGVTVRSGVSGCNV